MEENKKKIKEIDEITKSGDFKKRKVQYNIKGFITAISCLDTVVLDVVDKVLTPNEYEEITKNPLQDYNGKGHKQIISVYLHVIERVEYVNYKRSDLLIITYQEINPITGGDEGMFMKHFKILKPQIDEYLMKERIYDY
jgi:hypothetical protein